MFAREKVQVKFELLSYEKKFEYVTCAYFKVRVLSLKDYKLIN